MTCKSYFERKEVGKMGGFNPGPLPYPVEEAIDLLVDLAQRVEVSKEEKQRVKEAVKLLKAESARLKSRRKKELK
jgi:hypothetical protein